MASEADRVDPVRIAAQHPIEFDGPAVNFFEGALLGNGGLGAVVTTRPDALVVRFGHNSVWDQRIAEDNWDDIGTFQEVFEAVDRLSEDHDDISETEWYQEYVPTARENYAEPYPRPFPCGSLLLGFDSRRVEVIGHELDISEGRCRVELLVEGETRYAEFFVTPDHDRLRMRVVDEGDRAVAAPFDRVRLLPDPETPDAFPEPEVLDDTRSDLPETASGAVGFKQRLPRSVEDPQSGHPGDRTVAVTAGFSVELADGQRLVEHDERHEMTGLEQAVTGSGPFYGWVDLVQGPDNEIDWPDPAAFPDETGESGWDDAAERNTRHWEAFWEQSGVRLGDELFEATWYRNQYFFNCAVKPGEWCPGLFANWNYEDIGVAWHGDYHGNYNIQQPFWATFSSNHVEHHQAYVDMIDHVRPVAQHKAQEYYELDGACYPLSSYPVEMSVDPYPVPNWGWSICVTPWMIQSLWWHYKYTADDEFLADRVFEPLREVVVFLTEYITRPEAAERFDDGDHHVFPSVPPELYGLQADFERNYDCLPDLTLTKFVFDAFAEACTVLDRTDSEEDLLANVAEIRANLPDYEIVDTEDGQVWVSVPGEDPEVVYNVPANLMAVFPGEEYGIESAPEDREVAVTSYHRHRNEGGNDLVFLNLIGARLGELDLEEFKRHVEYSRLPNGTCTNMVRQIDGRYTDTTDFDFMSGYSSDEGIGHSGMGIWFENFSLPAVINECLLQSYTGTLRLFPTWPDDRDATFETLRAMGAFLVSAEQRGGQTRWVEITSEAGNRLEVVNPWPDAGAEVTRETGEGRSNVTADVITLDTKPDETITLEPATLVSE